MAFSGGSGTVGDPYLIANKADLLLIASYNTSNFKQIADIDLIDTPLGINRMTLRSGSYDGQNYKIKNMISNEGLFRATCNDGSTISITLSNIKLENAIVTSSENLGILLGTCWNDIGGSNFTVNITNCSVHGIVTQPSTYSTGGMIGYVYAQYSYSPITINMTGCYSNVKIVNGKRSGGLIGYTNGYSYVNITNCMTECEILANNYSFPSPEYQEMNGGYKYLNAYNRAGGLVGHHNGYELRIVDSSTKGTIVSVFAGGLVGYSQQDLHIDNCHSTCHITGYDGVGLIGCFWYSSAIGGLIGAMNRWDGNQASTTYRGNFWCISPSGGSYRDSTISRSYFRGLLFQPEFGGIAGGICGFGGMATFSQVYASEQITFHSVAGNGNRVGGIIGFIGWNTYGNSTSWMTITASVFNSDNHPTPYDGDPSQTGDWNSYGLQKTTAEMQSESMWSGLGWVFI